ncbi:MAG: membrane integrity-associated transporter subunit PqiC [Halioglobus sp.]|nr:membrane integrity-associated transporter subunit PqiC [Halioglobus sp.]
MNRKTLSLTSALTLVLLLAGCGTSPPNNYYLLSAHEFSGAGGETPSVGVGPIEIPAYLDRNSMVYNRAGNSLQVATLDLWAEPLVNGVERVMVLNLAGLLNTQDVQSFPWHPQRAPQYGVKVNVLQLEASEQQVSLTAEWLVYQPGDSAPIKRRISQLQANLGAGTPEAEQVAVAYSDLFYQLSELIAAAITADRSGSGER